MFMQRSQIPLALRMNPQISFLKKRVSSPKFSHQLNDFVNNYIVKLFIPQTTML